MAETEAAPDHLTSPGTALGTVAYMSPEQVLGKPVDARTDLFSLGVVLYEAVTGTLPFRGEASGAMFNEILNKAPTAPVRLNPEIPDELERAINKCLEKDKDLRYQSAAELRSDLKRLKRDTTSGATAAHPAARLVRGRRNVLPWVGAGLLAVLGALGGFWLSQRAPDTPTEPVTFTPFTSDGGMKAEPRLAPDGEKVAYAWTGTADDNWDIYVKALGADAEPLRLTEDPAHDGPLAWSPDGRRIAFVREREKGAAIYTVPSLGGRERKLIDVSGLVRDGSVLLPVLSWSPDGDALVLAEKATREEPARIVRLALESLEKEPLTSPPEGSRGDFFPRVSPDGTRLAYARSSGAGGGRWDVWVQPLEGGEARRLTAGAEYWALDTLAWTSDAKEIVFTTRRMDDLRMFRVRVARGEPEPLAGVGQGAIHPSIVGDRMVYARVTVPPADIWRLPGRTTSPADRVASKLIASSATDLNPAYSPDGQKVAFASNRSGMTNIWTAHHDGSQPVQVTDFETDTGTARWSPDGRRLVFDSLESGNFDLWVVDADGGIPRQLTHHPAEDVRGVWSPDGEWVYFGSNRGGPAQIWKIPSEGGEAVQVTQGESADAQVSRDGGYVYYGRITPRGVWRVPVAGGEEVEVLPGVLPRFWALAPSGIYFATFGGGTRTQDYRIQFHDFETEVVTELFRKEGPFTHALLAVSPDEKWILFSERPIPRSELMLVENFH